MVELAKKMPEPSHKNPTGEKGEIPEDMRRFIKSISSGTGGDCYIIAVCEKLYHRMMGEMPQIENPMASYWFEKARECLVERNHFKAQLMRANEKIKELQEWHDSYL